MLITSLNMEFHLSTCLIRCWEAGDEQSLVENANNFNVSKNLKDSFPYPYTLNDANDWINFNILKKTKTNFALVVDGCAVGGIGLHEKEDIFCKNMEIGYWLGEGYWGKGIVTEAAITITQYGFNNFDIERIYASVFATNKASMKVLEKADYKLEALLKKAVHKNGQVLDEYIFAKYR
ncbi:MAG: GNAT family N-acetyltransferase [Bacteroidia bacterium]